MARKWVTFLVKIKEVTVGYQPDLLSEFNPEIQMSLDLLIIGGGPGGYNGAIRASQLGLKVGLVDKKQTPWRYLPECRMHSQQGTSSFN